MKIWIDLTSLPHVHFFRALIKRLGKAGHEVLVTSREFGIMNDILDKNGIKYVSIGSHGGRGIKNKLIKSSERVLELSKYVSREKPDVGLSKHSVEWARVCFGLRIPSINVIDHETAEAAMKLMIPLSDIIVSPVATPIESLRRFGAGDVRQFYGVCETAHFHDFKPSPEVLKVLGLSKGKKIIISRAEPMLSSHNDHKSVLFPVLESIKDGFRDIDIVFIPRGKGDLRRYRNLDLIVPETYIDTLSLYSYAAMMIGAGSCMNRESCVGGCPTISICPDNLPGVDRFLIGKKMMHHSLKSGEIVSIASEILRNGSAARKRNGKTAREFEDPYGKIISAMNPFLPQACKSVRGKRKI